MENKFEGYEQELKAYITKQGLNFNKMTPAERLEVVSTTLILGGARPEVGGFYNDGLSFYLKDGGVSQYFCVNRLILDNPKVFFEVMDGVDNALQIPTQARMSLNGRKEYFAKRIYERFAKFDLSNELPLPVLKNEVIDKDWNAKMQDKLATVNDKAKANPRYFGDVVLGGLTDDENDSLSKAVFTRELSARAAVSALKSKEALREDTAALENNFGTNKIVENVNDVVGLVNQEINLNAHQFKRADLYEEGAKE